MKFLTLVLVSVSVSVLAILLVPLLVRILVTWIRFVKKLNRIPGPPGIPILGNALLALRPCNEIFQFCLDIIGTQPPLFKIWLGPLPVVVISKPEHAEVVLGSTKYIDKAIPYNFLESWLGSGLLTANGQKWHKHRKMITPTFHFGILNTFLDVFSQNCKIMIEAIKKEANGLAFDIGPYIQLCTMDIICETAMGTKINAQKENGDLKYIRSLHNISGSVLERMERPWLHMDFIYKRTPRGKQFLKNVDVLHEFTNQVIEERKRQRMDNKKQPEGVEQDFSGKKKRKAFLDLLLEARELGMELTDEELREEVDTFMFTGHDTMSAALYWSVQMLGEYPDAQLKAYEEQEQIFQGSDRTPSMKDLSDMKYLERVIKETLRLFVVVPVLARVLKEDITIDGHTIPAGTIVAIFHYLTHRHPDHYPGDPEKFDPDNFLPERLVNRHPYAFIPFSAGPRNCIGQKFAMLEMKTILSYLLRNYKLQSINKSPALIPELIIKPEGGVKVIISPRSL